MPSSAEYYPQIDDTGLKYSCGIRVKPPKRKTQPMIVHSICWNRAYVLQYYYYYLESARADICSILWGQSWQLSVPLFGISRRLSVPSYVIVQGGND